MFIFKAEIIFIPFKISYMKILLLATVYEIGGLSNVIRYIMENLDREKFDLVFVVENLAPRHYSLRADVKFINLDVKPAKGIGKLINIFRHLRRIRKTIICEAPDIVLGFGFAVNSLYLISFLWPVKNRPKAILGEYTEQLFVEERTMPFKEKAFGFIYKAVMSLLYHKADAIVSVSESLARRLRRFFLINNKKIKVIYVPVDIDNVKIRSQEKIYESGHKNNLPCVGTISRLSREKGINYLIEAFSDLLKNLDARLVIIGDGRERRNLEEMANDLNIEDKVSFLGWLENPYKYLREMDVFVLSSLWEGFPTVIVESMVCGTPVVATRSAGGVEELIEDGVNGLLVPSRDVKTLSDSIYRLLKDSGLKERFSREAARRIEQFDSRNITKQYESLILSL